MWGVRVCWTGEGGGGGDGDGDSDGDGGGGGSGSGRDDDGAGDSGDSGGGGGGDGGSHPLSKSLRKSALRCSEAGRKGPPSTMNPFWPGGVKWGWNLAIKAKRYKFF